METKLSELRPLKEKDVYEFLLGFKYGFPPKKTNMPCKILAKELCKRFGTKLTPLTPPRQ